MKLGSGSNGLLDQYKILVDLYKFYFELIMKVCTYYYIVTGAIVTFVLTEESAISDTKLKFSLILPIILSFSVSALFLFAAKKNKNTRIEVKRIAKELGFNTPPEMKILSIVLNVFASIMIITGFFLIALIVILI